MPGYNSMHATLTSSCICMLHLDRFTCASAMWHMQHGVVVAPPGPHFSHLHQSFVSHTLCRSGSSRLLQGHCGRWPEGRNSKALQHLLCSGRYSSPWDSSHSYHSTPARMAGSGQRVVSVEHPTSYMHVVQAVRCQRGVSSLVRYCNGIGTSCHQHPQVCQPNSSKSS
jgi:hypothetical protein